MVSVTGKISLVNSYPPLIENETESWFRWFDSSNSARRVDGPWVIWCLDAAVKRKHRLSERALPNQPLSATIDDGPIFQRYLLCNR